VREREAGFFLEGGEAREREAGFFLGGEARERGRLGFFLKEATGEREVEVGFSFFLFWLISRAGTRCPTQNGEDPFPSHFSPSDHKLSSFITTVDQQQWPRLLWATC
jgi:hypothetical protein